MLKALKGFMKAAKPAVELVELAGAVAVVGGATKQYAPRAWDFILATVGINKRPASTAGAIDYPDNVDCDDCALATSEVIVQDVECGCHSSSAPVSPPPVSAPPTSKPCAPSRAATPPPPADSPTGRWVWINGAWAPGPGYEYQNCRWVFVRAPVLLPRHPTTPLPTPSTRPLSGAGVVDVCPACASEPVIPTGDKIRIVPCELHDSMGRANAAHLESMTLGWAQSWEIGDSAAMPKIDDPKYVSAFGTFKSEQYIADMRAFHAAMTPNSPIPASVKPDLLARVAIFALNKQGRRYSDEAVATRELISSATGSELSALQSQLTDIDRSRDHVEALLAKLKNPAPNETSDVQTLATDIVAAAKTKGGLDRLFQSINSAQASAGSGQVPLNPGIVPPSVPGSGPVVAPPMAGAIDFDLDDSFCVEDVAEVLGLPAKDLDQLDVLFDARQELSDDELVALGAQFSSIDLGCAAGMCGVSIGE